MTFNMAICGSAIAIGGLWGNNSAMSNSGAARSGADVLRPVYIYIYSIYLSIYLSGSDYAMSYSATPRSQVQYKGSFFM